MSSNSDRKSSQPSAVTKRDDQPTFLDRFNDEHRGLAMPLMHIVTAGMLSMALHAVLLVILGLMMTATVADEIKRELVAAVSNEVPQVEELPEQPMPLDLETPEPIEISDLAAATLPTEFVSALPNPEPLQNNMRIDLAEAGIKTAPAMDLTYRVGGGGPISVAGARSAAGKQKAVATRGGNDASEAAVALALAWFAKHQMPDGGWSFDFKNCPTCSGQCRDSGERVGSRNAATALGLLPFLAAGQTHKEGKYRNLVLAGLQYLTNPQLNHQLQITPSGSNYTSDGGNFYTQGLCAMALCEAYAVSEDKELVAPAQAAINYIMSSQDHNGGGWRYSPGQAGDVSVTGWCLMALKSGHMGHLQVDPTSVRKCDMFLTSMQAKDGATYGYDKPADRPTTNAVGLLLRMYMGWKRENPALVAGVEGLAKRKPDFRSPYFNYYATQVLHQFEGPLWDEWNHVMRDHLISTQDKKGHQAGSWMIASPSHDVDAGGRLYVTALNCLTLEVYYRHLPLYRNRGSDDDF